MNNTQELEQLFSYGSLQLEAVQLATFGRKLAGVSDALPGYCQTRIAKDPSVIATSGEQYYLNAQFTGQDSDVVEGTRFQVTRAELERADIYEAATAYKRVSVQLKSGTHSWIYVSATSGQ